MSEIMFGASGALRMDEKFNILAFHRANEAITHLMEKTMFAIGDDKGRVMKLGAGETKLKFKRTFLGAEYKAESDKLRLKANVRVQTPFLPGVDAHLPAVVFSFKLKNTSKKKRTYHLGALVENFLDAPLHEMVCVDSRTGVQLSSATSLSIQSDYLTHCFLMDGNASVANYIQAKNPSEAFLDMLSAGKLQTAERPLASLGTCAALMRQVTIEGGENQEFYAVYAWYEPNIEWNGDRFKNGYIERFDSAVFVAQYVLQNMDSYLEFANKATSAIRASADGKSIEDMLFEELQNQIHSVPAKLVDIGNGKQFYNNRYTAPIVYLGSSSENPKLAYSAFDIETEADILKWQSMYGVSADGIVLPMPTFEDKTELEEPVFLLERQVYYILRWYSLIACNGFKDSLSECWSVLKAVFARLKTELNADVYAMRVWASDGVCDIYKTGMYALACKCMHLLSVFIDNGEFYLFKHAEFARFMEEYVFNGKYFCDFYPHDGGKLDRCSVMPLMPLILSRQLGFDMVSEDKLKCALENTYILNYSDAPENCGLRVQSDAEDIDSEVELLFVFALLEFRKKNLASLLAKARRFRKSELNINAITSMCPLISAFSGYSAKGRSLRVDQNGFMLFSGKTILFAELKKELTITVYGKPIVISEIVGLEGVASKCITSSDTEYMFKQVGDRVIFNTPVDLAEGEVLVISM